MIDYKLYHPEWFTRIRPDILNRSGKQCENCGKKEYSTYFNGIKEVRVILSISHQDHDINNNNYNNLKALCAKCHMQYDRPKHLETIAKNKARKYGLQLKFTW